MMLESIESSHGTLKLSSISDGEYYCVDTKIDIDENAIRNSIYQENPKIWKLILRKKPHETYFNGKYKKVNIPKKEGIDKGHFIAECFMKFLIPNYEGRSQFSYKDNGNNISGQSKIANRGYKESKGQEQFEQKIANHLQDYDTDVYYEIEEIKNGDEILGRRLYIHFYDSQEDDIHVFIPEK